MQPVMQQPCSSCSKMPNMLLLAEIVFHPKTNNMCPFYQNKLTTSTTIITYSARMLC